MQRQQGLPHDCQLIIVGSAASKLGELLVEYDAALCHDLDSLIALLDQL